MQTRSKTPRSARDHCDEIKLLAYHLWQESGCPAGQDVHFWLLAERQLLGAPAKALQPRPPAPSVVAAKAGPKRRRVTAGGKNGSRAQA